MELKVLHIGKYYTPAEGGIEHFLYDLVSWQTRHFPVRTGILVHNHEKRSTDCLTHCGNHFIYRVGVLGSFAYAPFSPSFPVALLRLLKGYKPDIIHIHMPNLSAFWLLLMEYPAPLILHWHSDVVPTPYDRTLRLLYPFYRGFERLLLKRAKSIIVTSPPYLNSSVALKDFKSKCRVIPLGIDPSRFPESLREKSDSSFCVLSAGRFTYYKGFQYLIEAMKYVDNAYLTIAGEGALWKHCKKYVTKLGLEDKVSLPGRVSNKNLARLFMDSNVFCLPSIERTEAFGLVLLEAMSFSRPLITTVIEGSGVTWVNENHVTGIHVPPRNPEALAAAIRFFKDNPDIAERYGKNGKDRFHRMFHISIVARKIWTLYEELF